MKIIVLKGSPNRHGSSNLLADNFIMGAKEAGHDVEDIDAAHANIKPCIAKFNGWLTLEKIGLDGLK